MKNYTMGEKYSTKDLTKAILIIAAAGVMVPALVAFPGLGYALKPFLKKDYQASRVKNTIKRLQKQQFISITEMNGETKIEISDKGRKRVLAYKIDELRLTNKKWDGNFRLVIFDIPETKRIARDFLRAKLKELGFYQLQKSVLITPWECKEIIDFVKFYYDVPNDVSLLMVKKLENEEYLKRYFNL